jgi:hypothetical protein
MIYSTLKPVYNTLETVVDGNSDVEAHWQTTLTIPLKATANKVKFIPAALHFLDDIIQIDTADMNEVSSCGKYQPLKFH